MTRKTPKEESRINYHTRFDVVGRKTEELFVKSRLIRLHKSATNNDTRQATKQRNNKIKPKIKPVAFALLSSAPARWSFREGLLIFYKAWNVGGYGLYNERTRELRRQTPKAKKTEGEKVQNALIINKKSQRTCLKLPALTFFDVNIIFEPLVSCSKRSAGWNFSSQRPLMAPRIFGSSHTIIANWSAPRKKRSTWNNF